MHAAAQKIARALISHSPFHQCARKISRFARNDDAGKALLSFSACLRRISPLSFIPPVPYPPLWGTFPSRGRLWVWGSGILVSPPSPWWEGSWTSPSFLWKEVPRRSGGWLPQRDEGEYTIVRPPVSSSRVQPRDLSCRRENSTYEEVRHSKSYEVRCLPLSHIFCLTSVQGRFLDFARNDDTGKAVLSFSTCLRRFSLSLSCRQCPIRPFGAPFPRGEGFGCGAAVFSFRRLLHGEKDLGLLPPSSGRRCPEGAEVGSRSGMRCNVRQPVLRCTTCMRLLRKSLGRSSHTLRFTGVQGRFLALLEMTMRGRRYSHFPPT